MKTADFRAPSAGRIHRSMAAVDAFVPAPLPPDIIYDPDLVLALSRADATLSELSGVGRQLPNPHLLITPYLRTEAVLSSRIEGTRANLTDVLLDELDEGDRDDALEEDRREVRNYVRALEAGLEWLRAGRPLTLNFVKALHAELMRQVRGERASPDQFRTVQNWIGPSESRIEHAIYVPPPPELLMECLSDWERFVNTHDLLPDLIQCAVMHEQFEAIHPFIDGNGRMGRLLITLYLMERERLSQPLLYLSAYIEARRLDYYDRLQGVRTDGDWPAWVHFFLAGVEQTAREAARQTMQLIDLREEIRLRVRNKPKALALIDHLFFNPYITVRRAQEILDVSTPTARNAIAALEQVGMVADVTEGAWRRLYLCRPILDVLVAANLGGRE